MNNAESELIQINRDVTCKHCGETAHIDDVLDMFGNWVGYAGDDARTQWIIRKETGEASCYECNEERL